MFTRAPSRQRLLLTPSRPSTSQSHLNLFPSDPDFEWGPRGITIVVEGDETRGSDRSILVWDSGYSLEPTRANVLLPWTESTPQTPTDSYSILSAASMTGVTFATDSDTLVRELMVPEDQSSTRAFPSASSSAASPSTSSSSEASPRFAQCVLLAHCAFRGRDHGRSRNTRAAFLQTFFERTKELVALPSHDADLSLATTLNNDAVMDYLTSSRASVPTSVSKVKALLPSSRSNPSSSSLEPLLLLPQTQLPQAKVHNPLALSLAGLKLGPRQITTTPRQL